MKLRFVVIAAILCVTLAGCAATRGETIATDTESTRQTETQPQETPTEDETIVAETEYTQQTESQPRETPVDEETMADLKEQVADPYSWYAKVLINDFAEPKEIDLGEMFYNGILGADNTYREDERAYLEPQWGEHALMLDCYRIPVAQMDEVLQTYLDISLQDTKGIGLDRFTYWEETDCYYKWTGCSNPFKMLIHSAYAQEDGTIAVYYKRDTSFSESVAAPEQVAVLRPTEDGYQIISNLPVINP